MNEFLVKFISEILELIMYDAFMLSWNLYGLFGIKHMIRTALFDLTAR